MSDDDGYYGTQKPTAGTDEYNAQLFVIRQFLNTRNYVALVKVINVTAPGGLALAGTVDVQPLVNQLDGQGNAIPHGVVNDLLYFRLQGGANAIILDPQVGDIGLCMFCDRDSSAVQSTKAAANPGSMRRNDMADGIYFGGMLNGLPNQFVMFTADGITIKSPALVKLEAPQIILQAETVEINATDETTVNSPTFTVNGDSQFNGKIDATSTITAPNVVGTTNVTFGGKSGVAHTHSGGTISGNTGAPN